jgi:hypothetical protein
MTVRGDDEGSLGTSPGGDDGGKGEEDRSFESPMTDLDQLGLTERLLLVSLTDDEVLADVEV